MIKIVGKDDEAVVTAEGPAVNSGNDDILTAIERFQVLETFTIRE